MYENGDFYEGDISGDWEHLKKNGIGVFKSVDGRVSDGYFEDDKFYGAVKVGIFKTGLNERHGFNRYIVKLKF